MSAESCKHLALSQLPLPSRTGPNGRHGSLAISCPPPFPQMSGPVDLLSTPTQGAKVHAVQQSWIWTTAVQTSSLPTARAHRGPGRTSGSPSSSITLSHPRTGSIIHGDLFARCNPSLDNPFRHTPFSLPPPGAPATCYSSHFNFAPPGRPFRPGAAPQHLSLRLIPRHALAEPSPPNRGAGPPRRRFSSANRVLDPLGGLFDKPPAGPTKPLRSSCC